MSKKQKLELTWIGKENRPKLEPRILLEDPAKSYHAKHRVADGDNLLALKALEAEFAGKVKCVFIDPPYNTGSAFTHYDDGVEHSIWLSLMRDRLEIIRRLLSEDTTRRCWRKPCASWRASPISAILPNSSMRRCRIISGKRMLTMRWW
jgi:adenine-specific DNA-methyltransferase